MPSTSNCDESKLVPKPKHERRVKQPTPNWLELPRDVMENILQRIGVVDVLENTQKVCTAWREIYKDPAMWKVIHMHKFLVPNGKRAFQEMCKHAVDRSQGQLLDLTIKGFCDEGLLQYVFERSSQLRRVEIIFCLENIFEQWGEGLKNLPLLEELSVGDISTEDIEAAGRYCPLLKTLKVNQAKIMLLYPDDDADDDGYWEDLIQNEIALAIGKNLPRLTHLELIRNSMNNNGLRAILDGCRHLESLDLRGCEYLDLKRDLGKRCSRQIKDLKLPHDYLSGHRKYMLYGHSHCDDHTPMFGRPLCRT
ncbi:hypothetical protein SSX86_013563 [Deinandra increscens subsp. villosa]|uniref:F-box domain-containing protein n=1 Tax=Deinandra increscens subsp. villosa TaxID=3103831 RepID=A0AAP0D5I4_9ASTR